MKSITIRLFGLSNTLCNKTPLYREFVTKYGSMVWGRSNPDWLTEGYFTTPTTVATAA